MAVIEAMPRSKFHLKVKKKEDEVIYEKVLDAMPACWYLHKDLLIYMEDFASNRIHAVSMKFGQLSGEKEFILPS